jgi:hypothetical protein
MTTSDKRQQLHHFIDLADNKTIEAIYAILENRLASKHTFSAQELESFYDRRKAYNKGETKNYTVQEAHSIIRNGSKK